MLPIELGGLLGVFLIFFEGFVNHVAADEHQQGEDDPMVELGYVFAECRCREIAENREQHLESAEPEGAFHGVLYSYAGYGQAFANGYGECIHSYGNRNKQDLNDYRNHGVTEGSCRITVRWASTSVPTRRLRLVEKTKHYCITKYKLPLLGSWRSETATEGE